MSLVSLQCWSRNHLGKESTPNTRSGGYLSAVSCDLNFRAYLPLPTIFVHIYFICLLACQCSLISTVRRSLASRHKSSLFIYVMGDLFPIECRYLCFSLHIFSYVLSDTPLLVTFGDLDATRLYECASPITRRVW